MTFCIPRIRVYFNLQTVIDSVLCRYDEAAVVKIVVSRFWKSNLIKNEDRFGALSRVFI